MQAQRVRADNRKCRLTYWLNRRLCSASTVHEILFQQPHDTTTPSGCACHPSTGEELPVQAQRVRADNRKCRLTYWLNRRLCSAPTVHEILFQQPHDTTTPSGYACHPSTGGELPVQAQRVRADNRKCRLTYWLNRRLCSAPTVHEILFQQPHDTTTPSGCACHPSTGGELPVQAQRVRADNRKCRLTYWLNRRLCSAPTVHEILFQQPHDTTTPSGCACHPSTGEELPVQAQRVRADNRKCRLTYWLNRRLCSAPTIS